MCVGRVCQLLLGSREASGTGSGGGADLGRATSCELVQSDTRKPRLLERAPVGTYRSDGAHLRSREVWGCVGLTVCCCR